jgi:hypothetical protein
MRAVATSSAEPQSAEGRQVRGARKNAERDREAVGASVTRALSAKGLDELAPNVSIVALEEAQRLLEPGEALVALSLATPDDTVLAIVLAETVDPSSGARIRHPARLTRLLERGRLLEVAVDLRSQAGGLRAEAGADDGASSAARERGNPARAGPLLEAIQGALSVVQFPAGVSTIHVVPDGALAYLPYPAIWPMHDVAVLPSATSLRRTRRLQRRAATERLAIGVSDYSSESLFGDLRGVAALTHPMFRGYVTRLRPLPGVVGEVKRVAGARGRTLLDHTATAANLLEILGDPKAPRWASIHFACHGRINADFPLLSGLALADGFFTAQEVMPLSLRTEMVVLSACDTATDPYVMGEGVAGLVRAFFQAGTPRLIASLWQVPDEPTAALMGYFYDLLDADQNTPPARALRRAQEFVRTTQNGRWASPSNWAAWTLWGAP